MRLIPHLFYFNVLVTELLTLTSYYLANFSVTASCVKSFIFVNSVECHKSIEDRL
jgi:hypothetical protein